MTGDLRKTGDSRIWILRWKGGIRAGIITEYLLWGTDIAVGT